MGQQKTPLPGDIWKAALISACYAQHDIPDDSSGFFTFLAFLLMRMSVLYICEISVCFLQK
jgi:hypothetical protein